ncbi:MAG: hypothetical protein AB7F40_08680 [Victivallaceae bacterium]
MIVTYAQSFEAVMMISFGFSWPISILKTIKAKNPTGKSQAFTALVIVGYIAGIGFKLCGQTDWVIVFYMLNACFASTDLLLCIYYMRRNRKAAAAVAAQLQE